MRRRDLLGAFGVSALLSSLKPVRARTRGKPDPLPSPAGYLRTNWSSDPFSRGSYSFLATGSGHQDRARLAEPLGARVFFAGEATHVPYASTVHAAYESGLLAADRIADTSHRRIAIVGAGVSGLACANILSAEGHEITVFEGRDRMGGRIWTDQQLGRPLDLGASWIHGLEGNPISALAAAGGITTVGTGEDYIVRGRNGRPIPDLLVPGWLTETAEIQHLFGAESDVIDWAAYDEEEDDYQGGDASFPSGYDQIIDSLVGGYRIELSTPVVAIEHNQNGVVLITSSGTEHRFDAVLVTVPLGVLKAGNISFTPPLPVGKQAAIDRLGFGLLDKVYLAFDTPFWDQDTTWILTPDTGLERGFFNQWFNLLPSTGAPILCAFNGGSAARRLARESDEALVAMATQVLERVYGE